MKSKIVLMSVVAMLVVGNAQANLILNPGFENGTGDWPDDWTIESAADGTVWSDEAYTGNKSMLLTGYGYKPESIIVSTDRIAVTAGTEYTFSAMVKSLSGGTASGTNLRVKWFDAAGNWVAWPDGGGWNGWNWFAVDAPPDWTEATALTIAAPAGAVEIEHAWVYSWKGDADDGVYIDDVSMVPEPMTMGLLGLGALMIRRRRKA